MKAVIQIGVRRQGRVVGYEGPFTPVTEQEVEVPVDFTTQQLAVAVTVAAVKGALETAQCVHDDVDTLEFMVDFVG